jgi:hypothetical protein
MTFPPPPHSHCVLGVCGVSVLCFQRVSVWVCVCLHPLTPLNHSLPLTPYSLSLSHSPVHSVYCVCVCITVCVCVCVCSLIHSLPLHSTLCVCVRVCVSLSLHYPLHTMHLSSPVPPTYIHLHSTLPVCVCVCVGAGMCSETFPPFPACIQCMTG